MKFRTLALGLSLVGLISTGAIARDLKQEEAARGLFVETAAVAATLGVCQKNALRDHDTVSAVEWEAIAVAYLTENKTTLAKIRTVISSDIQEKIITMTEGAAPLYPIADCEKFDFVPLLRTLDRRFPEQVRLISAR